MINSKPIKKDEETIFKLRSLYESYGYNQFKMNKFEEYDLYVRNKDFLVSSNIISFTDTNGKLMALKPDVTLSIIKNSSDDDKAIQKVYYNENVYRIPKNDTSFKEIMQVGLECIGDIDDYSVLEVIILAVKSLESITSDFVLDISHLGVLRELMDEVNFSQAETKAILKCFREKNVHELSSINGTEKLVKLVSTYGNLDKINKVFNEIYPNGLSNSAKLLTEIISVLEQFGYKDKVKIDFSVLNGVNYYSGIVFNGFVKGVPQSVLSGGQYDYLMEKMGRKSKGLGFAVYLDMLELFDDNTSKYNVDTLIVYDKNASLYSINQEVDKVLSQGQTVLVRNEIPQKLKYKNLVEVKGEGK